MLTQGLIIGAVLAIPLLVLGGIRDLWRAHRERRLGWGAYYIMAAFLLFVFAI